MTLETGTLLYNRYRIDETIAQGGMGAIYRAFDTSLSVQTAVKENLFSTEEYSRQFRREATILAGLRHPNLPRVTDHFVIPEQGQYLVMDFIEGEDLKQRLAHQGILSEDEAIRIGVAICDALAYLHQRPEPIIHRDIKPGNIKMDPKGQIFLVDFGLAKIAQQGQATTIGAQAFTPGYAPPEQYGQGPTGPYTDLYALGATLYAALSARLPEDGLARLMNSAQLTPLRTWNPMVSAELAAVLEKAMAVEPGQRYASASEMRSALLAVHSQQLSPTLQTAGFSSEQTAQPTRRRDAQPPAARTPTQPPPPASAPAAARRKPWWILPLVLVLVLAAAAGGVALSQKNSSPNTLTPTAQILAAAATITPAPPPTETAAPAAPSATPAANTPTAQSLEPTRAPSPQPTPVGGAGLIAFVSERSQKPQIWLMNPDGKDVRALTNLPDGACQPAWSPDGQQIVFISPCRGKQDEYKGASLFIIRADGSGLTPPINSMPGGDFDPAWSPDGKQIAFASLRENVLHLFVYHLETRQTTRLSRPSNYDRHPVWSPDGKQIAFQSTRLGQMQIWVMNADGSNPQEFSSLNKGAAAMPVWSPDGTVITFVQGQGLQLMTRQVDNRTSPETPVGEKLNLAADAAYSPDSYWLAFETWRLENNHDIYRVGRNGTNLTRLTDDPAFDYQPAWQPAPLQLP